MLKFNMQFMDVVIFLILVIVVIQLLMINVYQIMKIIGIGILII